MRRQDRGAKGPFPACFRPHDERGSAGALMTVGIGLVVAIVFYSGVLVIHWFAVARQAEQAAELAALGGAGAAASGGAPCAAAGKVAAANDARMVRCEVEGAGRYAVVQVWVGAGVDHVIPGAPEEVVRSATAEAF